MIPIESCRYDRFAVAKAIRRERLKQARARGTHTKDEWHQLVAEFDGVCVRCCGKELPLERDHIVPLYLGGSDAIQTIQPICARCNASKGPETTNWKEIRRSQRTP